MSWTACADLSVGLKMGSRKHAAERSVAEEWHEKAREAPTNIMEMIELVEQPSMAQACEILGIDPDELLPKTVYHFAGVTGRVDSKCKLKFENYQERRLELLAQAMCQAEKTRKRRSVPKSNKNLYGSRNQAHQITLAKQKKKANGVFTKR